jgi:hypothetical protein
MQWIRELVLTMIFVPISVSLIVTSLTMKIPSFRFDVENIEVELTFILIFKLDIDN